MRKLLNFNRRPGSPKPGFVFLFSLVLSALGLSCGAPPADLRASVPAETLVYVETRDLGRTLNALTGSPAFRELARDPVDFSALDEMPAAFAVTGFEASENAVTEENAVLNFRPLVTAVADTRAWNWQTVSFVENTLGEFVNQIYGGEVVLETNEKAGGRSFVWTAPDGRKAFAFVKDSRVFFSNDEAALEKSLAAFRGEAESLAKSGKSIERDEAALAFGYVAPDGIAQLANLAGVSAAVEATEEEEGRSFIARVLPQIVRNAVREISWTARQTEQGIEDRFDITLTPPTAAVFKETLAAPVAAPNDSAEFLPADVHTATRYRLENPRIAWRSLLLVAGKSTDPVSAGLLNEFSGSVLEPYGISDAENFLSAIDGAIWTAAADSEGEKNVAVFVLKNAETARKSIGVIDFKAPPIEISGAPVWKSQDGELAAAFAAPDNLVLGETETVAKCLEARAAGQNFAKNRLFAKFVESRAAAVTYGRETTERVVEALGTKRAENMQMTTSYLVETRFTEKGIERRTVSPFGLIGTILEQFGKD